MTSLRSGGDAAVGMMDAAYFTGRRELLDFFNELLSLNLSKIEETASGAVACQLCDYIYPGSIPMSKVNWAAKSDYEYVQNYKLLQNALNKHQVKRHIDVPKLIKAKYQDNLEACQWYKAWFDQSGAYRPDYDPVAAREKGKGADALKAKGGGAKSQQYKPSGTGTSRSTTSARATTRSGQSAGTVRTTTTTINTRTTAVSSKENKSVNNQSGEVSQADAALMKTNSELNVKIGELEASLADVERERDFFWDKLRDVEVMLQVYEEKDTGKDPDHLVKKIFKVLYATAEDNVMVGEDGEIDGEGTAEENPTNPTEAKPFDKDFEELLEA